MLLFWKVLNTHSFCFRVMKRIRVITKRSSEKDSPYTHEVYTGWVLGNRLTFSYAGATLNSTIRHVSINHSEYLDRHPHKNSAMTKLILD